MAALRATERGRGSLVGALALSAHGVLTGNNDCTSAGPGGCLPLFPELYSTAVLGGYEHVSSRGISIRGLVGPAAFVGGGILGDTLRTAGAQGRLDLGVRPKARLGLVASVRGAVLPSYRGTAYLLGAAGLGIRIQ